MGEGTRPFGKTVGELCRVMGADLTLSCPCCCEKGVPYLTTNRTKAECRMPACKLMCMHRRQVGARSKLEAKSFDNVDVSVDMPIFYFESGI